MVTLDNLVDAAHHDHPAEVAELIAFLEHAAQLRLVLHEHDVRLGMVEHVLSLAGAQGLIHGHRAAADEQDRSVGGVPLGPVTCPDADVVAGLDALLNQERGNPARTPTELPPGDWQPPTPGPR